jgi:hypothetical protein
MSRTPRTKKRSLADVPLDLSLIPPPLHAQARAAAQRGDVLCLYVYADSNSALGVFAANIEPFALSGLFCEALLTAWTHQKHTVGWGDWMKETLAGLRRKCLLDASDPLPEGGTFTVYRGVENHPGALFPPGDPRGVSWTLDPAVARIFASRFGRGGTVYRTTVRRSDVYAYIDGSGRGEKEVLLVLPGDYPIEVHEEIAGRRS